MTSSEQSAEFVTLPRRSWLVQRLNKPHRTDTPLGTMLETFSFGGGRKNGGIRDDAMALIRRIWSFDYMGAAEFEWGAVPKALESIVKARRSLRAGFFEIALKDVAEPFMARGKSPAIGHSTIYWIAPKNWVPAVEQQIREWARDGYRARLQEPTRLDSSLRPSDDYDTRTCGWLELDNGFMFFTDREMWEQACTLFGLRFRPGESEV